MQEDEDVMCVICDVIYVRDDLSENRKNLLLFLLKTSGSSSFTSPLPLLTAHHTEAHPPLQALLCYPVPCETEPERKLNETYFHSTYPCFSDTPSCYRRHQKSFYWLSSGCPVLLTEISWLENSEMGLTGVKVERVSSPSINTFMLFMLLHKFSKYGPGTNSISITWEIARNS